jgi:hypothetical protein
MFFIKYFFRPVFGRFWQKTAAVRLPIFLGQPLFSGVGFELFCRIFGWLATVVTYLKEGASLPPWVSNSNF